MSTTPEPQRLSEISAPHSDTVAPTVESEVAESETAPAAGFGALAGLLRSLPAQQISAGTDPLGGSEAPPEITSMLARRRGSGSPLPGKLAGQLGEAMGADFSGVSIHTDPEAATLTKTLQAKAFTHGSDIYFGSGTYAPDTRAGRHLLSHELAHVAQQDLGASSATGTTVGRADDPAEAQAEAIARSIDLHTSEAPRTLSPSASGNTVRRLALSGPIRRLIEIRDHANHVPYDVRRPPVIGVEKLPPQEQTLFKWLLESDDTYTFADIPELRAALIAAAKLESMEERELEPNLQLKEVRTDGNANKDKILNNMKEANSRSKERAKQQAILLAEREAAKKKKEAGFGQSRPSKPAKPKKPEVIETEEERRLRITKLREEGQAKKAAEKMTEKPVEKSAENTSEPFDLDEAMDAGLTLAGAHLLAEKHGMPMFTRAADVISFARTPEAILADACKLIIQTSQQRGDMHHLLPALTLRTHTKMVLCLENAAAMLGEADLILGSFKDQRHKVAIYHGSPNHIISAGAQGADESNPAKKNPVESLTYSTTILREETQRDPLNARKVIQQANTGGMSDEDRAQYQKWVTKLGFKHGPKYVLVSHRDSGHQVPLGRKASHPEFDTGEDGYDQLIRLCHEAGLTPVPMGAPPAPIYRQMHPNMVEYWMPDRMGGATFPEKTKQQTEYGLIRYLAEEYNAKQLAMRSGNTDAGAFAGMETVFLDMDSEDADPDELAAAELDKPENVPHNRSWRRAATLENVLPGMFHQVLLENPRTEKALAAEGLRKPNRAKTENPDWSGKFSDKDVARIKAAIDLFLVVESSRPNFDRMVRPKRTEKAPVRESSPEIASASSSAKAAVSQASSSKGVSKKAGRSQTAEPKKANPKVQTTEEFWKENNEDTQQMMNAPTFGWNELDMWVDRLLARLKVLEGQLAEMSPKDSPSVDQAK